MLEVLREPLETGQISISRAAGKAEFPARFQLVAAMNPCPCGHLGDPAGNCRCTSEQIARYQGRISGPLLDRIDIQVQVPTQPAETFIDNDPVPETPSARIRERVIVAHRRQLERQGCANAQLENGQLERHCRLDRECRAFLLRAMNSLGLSARGYHRILRVARSIADLAEEETIALPHVTEAVGYRRLDAGIVVH